MSDKENAGVKKSLKIKSKQDQSWTKAGPQPDRTPLGEVQNKKRKVHDKEIGKSLDQIPQAAKRLPSRKDVCTFCSKLHHLGKEAAWFGRRAHKSEKKKKLKRKKQ